MKGKPGNILGLYCCWLILVSSSSLWDWVTCQRESVRLRNVEDWVLSSSAQSAPALLILDQGQLAREPQLIHYAKPTLIIQHLTQLGLWLWPFKATQTSIDLRAQTDLSFTHIFKNKTKGVVLYIWLRYLQSVSIMKEEIRLQAIFDVVQSKSDLLFVHFNMSTLKIYIWSLLCKIKAQTKALNQFTQQKNLNIRMKKKKKKYLWVAQTPPSHQQHRTPSLFPPQPN